MSYNYLLEHTKFTSIRLEQEFALSKWLTSSAPFFFAELPTGTGKSLFAWLAAQASGARTLILTATKGQQDQYEETFKGSGIADLRGMGNYPCRALPSPLRCDIGPCLDGDDCIWHESGCAYFDRLRKAREARVVVSNYSKWFSHPDPYELGKFDLLICDEGHDVADELTKYAGASFDSDKVDLPGPEAIDWQLWQWVQWAELKRVEASSILARPDEISPTEKREVRRLIESFNRLINNAADDWAWEYNYPKLVRFEPIRASAFAESFLWRGIPRVIVMSATLRPEDMQALGVPSGASEYLALDSPFPVENRPIYLVKLGFRLHSKMSENQLREWVAVTDAIMDEEHDESGLIHTVSYERMRYLYKHSRHQARMLIHTEENTKQAIDRFRRAKPGTVQLSPVLHTGYDFPYGQARWQIIGKVPFPDCSKGISKARRDADPTWDKKYAAKRLVQMAGRIVRATDDCGRTYILDDAMEFLFSHYRPYFARWFRKAFKPVAQIPKRRNSR